MTGPGDKDDDNDRTRIGQPLSPTGAPDDHGSPPPDSGASGASGDGDEDDRTRVVTSVPEAVDSTPEPTAPSRGPAPVPPSGGAAATVTVGTLINNNYEIREVLKAGGMGEVYRGVEIGTGDPVAIKVIRPDLAEDEKTGQLFKREARTLRQLSNEAIVRYYNYVYDRDIDRYCLIMEFISGVPLSDHTQRHGKISVEDGRILLRRLARGLARAHGQDVIHRDLSPDNVMLPDGVVGQAVLIDFGIAKSNVQNESTLAGQFAGKFKYVSPEQLGHHGGLIGPRSDIYGLALLLCAALIGKPLDLGGSIVAAVQARQSIPDLSAVPDELRPILSYMLEPDPGDRPPDMKQVEHLLDHPEEMPEKYLDGVSLPPRARSAPPGMSLPPGMRNTSGLQSPPTSREPLTATGVTGLGTYGGGTGSQPLSSAPPQALPPDREGSGLVRVLAVVVIILVGVVGYAGYYAHDQGLLPLGDTQGATEDGGDTGGETDTPPTLPPRLAETREGFLAEFESGPCSYVTRRSLGPNAGTLAAFSGGGARFDGLADTYETRFGTRPALLPRRVDAAQCAALDFMRALQGRDSAPVQMYLDTDSLLSGEAVTARIAPQGADSLWAVLISPRGAVYSLTDRIEDAGSDERSLRFGLTLNEGAEAAPQLVMVVASDAPLVQAASARNGVTAADLLPLVLDDITSAGGAGATAALTFLMLEPPQAQEDPAPDTGDTGDAQEDGG